MKLCNNNKSNENQGDKTPLHQQCNCMVCAPAPTFMEILFDAGGRVQQVLPGGGEAVNQDCIVDMSDKRFSCTRNGCSQAGVYDEFCQAVKEAVDKFKVGDGLVDGTTMGPLISPAAVDRVGCSPCLYSFPIENLAAALWPAPP